MLDKLRKQWDAAIRYAGGCPIDFRPTAKEIAGIVLEEAAKVCEFQAERFTQGSPLEGNKPYAAHECAAAIRALAEGCGDGLHTYTRATARRAMGAKQRYRRRWLFKSLVRQLRTR